MTLIRQVLCTFRCSKFPFRRSGLPPTSYLANTTMTYEYIVVWRRHHHSTNNAIAKIHTTPSNTSGNDAKFFYVSSLFGLANLLQSRERADLLQNKFVSIHFVRLFALARPKFIRFLHIFGNGLCVSLCARANIPNAQQTEKSFFAVLNDIYL